MLRLLEPVLFHPAVQPCCGSPYVGSRAFLSRETAGQMPQCQCRQQAVAGQIARHIGTRHAAGRPATGKQAVEHRTVCPLYPRMVIYQQASLRMEQRTGDPHRAIGCPQQGIRRELPPESVWFAALGKQARFIQCCLKRVAVDPDARCQLGRAVRD